MEKYDIELVEGPIVFLPVAPIISLDTVHPCSTFAIKVRANNVDDLLWRVESAKQDGITSYFHYQDPYTMLREKLPILAAQKDTTEWGDTLTLQLALIK